MYIAFTELINVEGDRYIVRTESPNVVHIVYSVQFHQALKFARHTHFA